MKYLELKDEELCLLSQKGDKDATEELLKRYKPLANKMARKHFNSAKNDIEDYAQNGLIAVFNAIMGYKKSTPFRPYAVKCISNAIKTSVNRTFNQKDVANKNALSFSESEMENKLYTDVSPESEYIFGEYKKELNQKIKDVLSGLEYKIYGLYIEGDSYTEICEKLGKDVKSIDNAIQRIRKKINVIVGNENG